MSQSGEMLFYLSRATRDSRSLFLRWFEITGADRALYCTRLLAEDNTWNRRKIEESTDEELDDVPDEHLKGPFYSGDALALIDWPYSCMFRFPSTRLALDLKAGIESCIPESIRGSVFCPTDPIITIGWHDIIDDSGNISRRIGRASASFGLTGYGTPNDWKAYRNAVFSVPEVRELKARLEEVAGPLDQAIWWSI